MAPHRDHVRSFCRSFPPLPCDGVPLTHSPRRSSQRYRLVWTVAFFFTSRTPEWLRFKLRASQKELLECGTTPAGALEQEELLHNELEILLNVSGDLRTENPRARHRQ